MIELWDQAKIPVLKKAARSLLNGCPKHKRSSSVPPALQKVKKSKIKKPGQAAAARRRKAKALGALRDEGYESCCGRIESVAVRPAFNKSPKCRECLKSSVLRLMEQVYLELDPAKHWHDNVEQSDSMRNRQDLHTISISGVVGKHPRLSFLFVYAANSYLASAVAYSDEPSDPLSSAVWNAVGGEATNAINAIICKRYGAFALLDKWALLSVLAYSTTFRKAALTLPPTTWNELVKCTVSNEVSLQVFAKVRGLNLVRALKPLLGYMKPGPHATATAFIDDIRTDPSLLGEHAYVVAGSIDEVRRPMFEGEYQVHVDENVYSHELYTKEGEPQYWPKGVPWPGNPMQRSPNQSMCVSCLSKSSCNCNMATSEKVLRPLVELHQYPHRGVGIRALQYIPAGSILDEYVGVLRHGQYDEDPIYAYAGRRLGDGEGEDVVTISSKSHGNWTRFINHSCDAATTFRERTLGDKYRVLVVAERDIEMFEEILISYGDAYWENKICCCGEPNCVTTKAEVKAAEITRILQGYAHRFREGLKFKRTGDDLCIRRPT